MFLPSYMFLNRRAASGAFTPASLPLSLWVEASYAASPWNGKASAGGSNSRNFSEGTNPPAAGSAVNGLTPADFDGTNDVLSNATALSSIYGAAAFTLVALVNVDTLAADNESAFNETALFSDTGGYTSMNISTSGLRGYVFNGGSAKVTNRIAISAGTWTMIQFKLDSGNIYAAKNAGSWTTGVACGAPDALTGTAVLGRNFGAASFIDGKCLSFMAAASVLSAGDLTNIKDYWNTTFGLSL